VTAPIQLASDISFRTYALYMWLVFALIAAPLKAQQHDALTLSSPPVAWVRATAAREVSIIEEDGSFPFQYTVHKIDKKADSVRVVIETGHGSVARTMLLNGKPLSASDEADEHKRLQEILDDPAAWATRQKRNQSARSYATDLVRLMPDAMIWTYVDGQPQLPNANGHKQTVLDFKPNPEWHPPTMTSQALTGIAGRVWIDQRTRTLLRIDGNINQPVDFGWGGVFAKIYPGGHIVFEQSDAGNGHWIYSFLDQNITIRELLIHTVQQKSTMTASDVHLLPAVMDVHDAVLTLLGIPSAQFSAHTQGR